MVFAICLNCPSKDVWVFASRVFVFRSSKLLAYVLPPSMPKDRIVFAPHSAKMLTADSELKNLATMTGDEPIFFCEVERLYQTSLPSFLSFLSSGISAINWMIVFAVGRLLTCG